MQTAQLLQGRFHALDAKSAQALHDSSLLNIALYVGNWPLLVRRARYLCVRAIGWGRRGEAVLCSPVQQTAPAT